MGKSGDLGEENKESGFHIKHTLSWFCSANVTLLLRLEFWNIINWEITSIRQKYSYSNILHKLKLWSRRPRKDLEKFRPDLKSADYYKLSHKIIATLEMKDYNYFNNYKL